MLYINIKNNAGNFCKRKSWVMVDMCLPLLQITMSVEFPHHNDEKKNVWRPSNLGYDLWAYDCGGYIQLWRTTVIAMKQAKKMVQVDVRDRDKHWIQLLFDM